MNNDIKPAPEAPYRMVSILLRDWAEANPVAAVHLFLAISQISSCPAVDCTAGIPSPDVEAQAPKSDGEAGPGSAL